MQLTSTFIMLVMIAVKSTSVSAAPAPTPLVQAGTVALDARNIELVQSELEARTVSEKPVLQVRDLDEISDFDTRSEFDDAEFDAREFDDMSDLDARSEFDDPDLDARSEFDMSDLDAREFDDFEELDAGAPLRRTKSTSSLSKTVSRPPSKKSGSKLSNASRSGRKEQRASFNFNNRVAGDNIPFSPKKSGTLRTPGSRSANKIHIASDSLSLPRRDGLDGGQRNYKRSLGRGIASTVSRSMRIGLGGAWRSGGMRTSGSRRRGDRPRISGFGGFGGRGGLVNRLRSMRRRQ